MLTYVLFVVGFVFLIKGADFFIAGAASLAKRLKMSNLLIGLTVIALGTSLPELLINLFAANTGSMDIALGNILGSNLSNTLLILGIIAVLVPLNVHQQVVWREIPFIFMSSIVLFLLANDSMIEGNFYSSLTRIDGLILLCFFVMFIYYMVLSSKTSRIHIEEEKVDVKTKNSSAIAALIIAGMLGLYLGGKWIVEGSVEIAEALGISEFIISATVIALGSSLPELVTTIIAATKHDVDMAVGNILGSNIYNIFMVLGITSVTSPMLIESRYNFDITYLLVATFLLFAFMFTGKRRHTLEKGEGISFIGLYLLYIVLIIVRG